jgi:hypothetical protein
LKPHVGRELHRTYPGVVPATAAVSEVFIVIVKQGTVADFYGHCISVEIRRRIRDSCNGTLRRTALKNRRGCGPL